MTGYEIHMGATRPSERAGEAVLPFALLEDGRADGLVRRDGRVMGTYLHGLFDNDAFTRGLIAALAERKGVSPAMMSEDALPAAEYKERQYDKLAALVRSSLDMDKVYRIMGFEEGK